VGIEQQPSLFHEIDLKDGFVKRTVYVPTSALFFARTIGMLRAGFKSRNVSLSFASSIQMLLYSLSISSLPPDQAQVYCHTAENWANTIRNNWESKDLGHGAFRGFWVWWKSVTEEEWKTLYGGVVGSLIKGKESEHEDERVLVYKSMREVIENVGSLLEETEVMLVSSSSRTFPG
jgi:hypothetical protein